MTHRRGLTDHGIPVPREVYEGIERVRQEGLANMLDRPRVIELCMRNGDTVAAKWLLHNRDGYSRAIFQGFRIADHEEQPDD